MLPMLEYTAASGRLDHATFREQADASVGCLGFRAKLLHADRLTGLWPVELNDLQQILFYVTLAY